MHSRIAEGTEHLSEEARKRVVAARRKAIDARRAAMRSARRGADAVSDFYDRQPLVVGALALAVGAALAGALPRTRTEDEYMGEHSDHLFDEAERLFAEESKKLNRVVAAAKDEAMTIADEMKSELDRTAKSDRNAAKTAVKKVKNAGKRVARAARDKAEAEDLGKPKI